MTMSKRIPVHGASAYSGGDVDTRDEIDREYDGVEDDAARKMGVALENSVRVIRREE
jgi:hypothetical protein